MSRLVFGQKKMFCKFKKVSGSCGQGDIDSITPADELDLWASGVLPSA